MESMVEENGSAVDPLSTGSQSGDAAPAIATSVQSLNRTHQQQTHHLVASTSIVQLTLPSSGTTQVYRRNSCVSMSDHLFTFLVSKHVYITYLCFNYNRKTYCLLEEHCVWIRFLHNAGSFSRVQI